MIPALPGDIRHIGMLTPNMLATFRMVVAHGYSMFLRESFTIGTFVFFAMLFCGAAAYIAVPAVQRFTLPKASQTLPLADSLGIIFSYNVTIGIPLHILIATALIVAMPVD